MMELGEDDAAETRKGGEDDSGLDHRHRNGTSVHR